ncbi:MAG: MBL fold metallo-hydrolase [Planctomycetota bacterium]
MIVERALHPAYTSNSYLVVDRPGGAALVVDTGADAEPLIRRVRDLDARVAVVLLTHHHHDHVEFSSAWTAAFRCEVAAHPLEAARLAGTPSAVTRHLRDDESFQVGELLVRCLHVPGHTDGQLTFVVRHGDEHEVFTGDTLFKGSVGGTRAPGHTDIQDLRRSLDRLMQLPRAWSVRPGHTDPTTIGAEHDTNPFLLAFRGEREVRPVPAETSSGERVDLLLRARDYDGGTKCWVRWSSGAEDVVPGSRVRELD